MNPTPSPGSLAELELFAQVHLPKRAQDVRVFSDIGIDRVVFARFSLLPEDWPAFLEQSSLTGRLTENYRPFPPGFGPPVDWWDVAGAQSILGLNGLVDRLARQLVVDVSDPGRWTVYLVAFET